MMGQLAEKTVLITGAAHGIGAASALLFAAEGASIVLADIDAQVGEAVAEQCGVNAEYLHLDVTREEDWQQLASDFQEAGTSLDVLVNNVGLRIDPDIEALTLDAWNQAIAVNLTSVFLGTKYMLPFLRRAGSSAIVNVGSVAALVGFHIAPAYQASKGGIRALTKHLAVQYARDGIRVNCIHPGTVDTRMSRTMPDAERVEQKKVTPQGHFGAPEDIAHAILFLATANSAYMTGGEIVIDGGYTAM